MDIYTQPDWQHSALLTIDVQEDFTRPDAPAYIPGTDKILPALGQLTRYYRSKRRPVIHIVRLYRRDGSNADLCRRLHIESGNRIVAPGSAGAELVKELKPDVHVQLDHELLLKGKTQKLSRHEWALYKPRWGGFFQTGLEQMLREHGITTIVVTGCNFPNCPRTTIYEASERDFRAVLIRDAVSGLYEKGEQELHGIGVGIFSTNEITLKSRQ